MIERGSIGGDVRRRTAVRGLHGFDESGELAVDVGFGAEAAHAFEPGDVRRGGITDVTDVIDDDAQAWEVAGETQRSWEVAESIDIEREAAVSQQPEMAREDRVGEIGAEFARGDTDTAEERMGAESAEMVGESRFRGTEVTDKAHDARMLVGEAQDPVIVLRPGARFDHHRLTNPVRGGDSLPIGREDRAIEEAALGRPGYALAAGRVVEVRVRIDDATRCRPGRAADGERGGAGRASEGTQEGTTIGHRGHGGDDVQTCKSAKVDTSVPGGGWQPQVAGGEPIGLKGKPDDWLRCIG